MDRAKEENDVSKVPRASLNFLHRVGCIYHTLLGPQTLEESFQRFKEILTEDFNNEQDP